VELRELGSSRRADTDGGKHVQRLNSVPGGSEWPIFDLLVLISGFGNTIADLDTGSGDSREANHDV